MGVELLIFDWSGVISDDRKPVYEADMRILREHGKPVMTFEEWLERTTLTPIEFLANHGVHGDPEELFALYKKYFDEAVKSGIVPTVYPDARDILQYLQEKEKKLAVLSSHPEENLRSEAEQYDLAQYLALISGNSKDKVKGLQDVCEQFRKHPSSALYIGDTIYDIRAAKEARVHSGAVCEGYHKRERLKSENPEVLLGCLSDLKLMI